MGSLTLSLKYISTITNLALTHKLGVVNRIRTCLAASFYNRVITLCRCMPLGWSVPTHIQARACQPNLPHKLGAPCWIRTSVRNPTEWPLVYIRMDKPSFHYTYGALTWWWWWDSNSRSFPYEGAALAAMLHHHIKTHSIATALDISTHEVWSVTRFKRPC